MMKNRWFVINVLKDSSRKDTKNVFQPQLLVYLDNSQFLMEATMNVKTVLKDVLLVLKKLEKF